MIRSRVLIASALIIGSIVEIDAGRIGNPSIVDDNVPIVGAMNIEEIGDNIESRHNLRQLQGRPNDPELALTTSGSTIQGTADFNQGGQQTIRLFKENCSDKFEDTSVSPADYAEFVVISTTPSDESVGSVYSASGSANDDVVFELSMKELYTHLEDNTGVAGGTDANALDGGIVTVCIQLESVSTIKNFIQNITIDLTHSATIDTTVAQPDASVGALNIDTTLTAVVCDYNSENAIAAPITVPGMIYVCITCTEGYRIEEGTLTADSAFTGTAPDEAYNNYLDTTNEQTKGTQKTLTDATANDLSNTWSSDPTSERLADNKVRVSVQGLSSWAATATNTAQTPPSSVLTITVTAQFDPVRRLATVAAFASDKAAEKNRHLRQRDDEIIIYAQDAEDKDEDEDSQYHWGRLRPDGGKAAREKPKLKKSIFAESAMEFAQATTTVLIHGPAPVDNTLSVPIAGAIAGTILLCCSFCCFFLGACLRRRRDDDEEEKEHEKNSDTGSVDTYTENDLSSKGSSGHPPAMAFVYDVGAGIYDIRPDRPTIGRAA